MSNTQRSNSKRLKLALAIGLFAVLLFLTTSVFLPLWSNRASTERNSVHTAHELLHVRLLLAQTIDESRDFDRVLENAMHGFSRTVRPLNSDNRAIIMLFDDDELLASFSTWNFASRQDRAYQQHLTDVAQALAAQVATLGQRPSSSYRRELGNQSQGFFTRANIEWESVLLIENEDERNLFIVTAGQIRPYAFVSNFALYMLSFFFLTYYILFMYGVMKAQNKAAEQPKSPNEENPDA